MLIAKIDHHKGQVVECDKYMASIASSRTVISKSMAFHVQRLKIVHATPVTSPMFSCNKPPPEAAPNADDLTMQLLTFLNMVSNGTCSEAADLATKLASVMQAGMGPAPPTPLLQPSPAPASLPNNKRRPSTELAQLEADIDQQIEQTPVISHDPYADEVEWDPHMMKPMSGPDEPMSGPDDGTVAAYIAQAEIASPDPAPPPLKRIYSKTSVPARPRLPASVPSIAIATDATDASSESEEKVGTRRPGTRQTVSKLNKAVVRVPRQATVVGGSRRSGRR
jgi:hypothetical protein